MESIAHPPHVLTRRDKSFSGRLGNASVVLFKHPSRRNPSIFFHFIPPPPPPRSRGRGGWRWGGGSRHPALTVTASGALKNEAKADLHLLDKRWRGPALGPGGLLACAGGVWRGLPMSCGGVCSQLYTDRWGHV